MWVLEQNLGDAKHFSPDDSDSNHILTGLFFKLAARRSAVGWGTMLQAGKLRV
jgi:hypothetical protein